MLCDTVCVIISRMPVQLEGSDRRDFLFIFLGLQDAVLKRTSQWDRASFMRFRDQTIWLRIVYRLFSYASLPFFAALPCFLVSQLAIPK